MTPTLSFPSRGVRVTKRSVGLFPALCVHQGLPRPVLEYVFAPPRKYRADYAWPTATPPLMIEVEGGVWNRGKHGRGSGIVKDMAKQNVAVLAGWRMLRVTPQQLCTPQTLQMVREALNGGR